MAVTSSRLKLAAVAAGILVSLLSLLAMLQMHRFEQLLIEVESALISVPGVALRNDVERTLALGLPLNSNGSLQDMLRNVRKDYPIIVSIHLLDAELAPGQVLWQDGAPLATPRQVVDAQRRSPKAVWFGAGDAGGYILSWPIRDPLGQLVANLALRFDKTKPMALIDSTGHAMLAVWAALCLGGLLILLPVLWHLLADLDRMVARAGDIIMGRAHDDDHNSDIAALAEQIAAVAPPAPCAAVPTGTAAR